ncbi:MAG: hypothetical protein ACLUJB_16555 [Coprobacillus cateniformis]|uniref:hypothetical protein n=1 Tax=Coprobacillus cateniformis TaxID=100884 RepID=UPI003990DE1B
MLLTRKYIKTLEREEIKIGNKYYLGELVNGDEDLEEIIESGAIGVDEKDVVEFVVTDLDKENLLDCLVVVKSIY